MKRGIAALLTLAAQRAGDPQTRLEAQLDPKIPSRP